MTHTVTVDRLEYAVAAVCQQVRDLARLDSWHDSSEYELWYELVACALGSQVRYEHSLAAANYLHNEGLLGIYLFKDGKRFEARIANALSKPIIPSINKLGFHRYRFPRSKARQIRQTAESLYANGNTIRWILENSSDAQDARRRIIRLACGLGPKQTSLFLRNIGFADSIAILDTHVIRYMNLVRLFSVPVYGWTGLREYEKFEKRLESYARRFEEPMAYLDTAIWVVMRVLSRTSSV